MSAAQVPPGYKRTEVGVIPEDWDISTLESICSFENGDRGANYPSPDSFVVYGIPFINAGHISDGRISMQEMDFITQDSFDRLRSGKFKPGDILFCLRGSLGKYGVVPPGFGNGAIASSLVIVRPVDRKISREYIEWYFASEYCVQMIREWAGGAAQPNLGAQDLHRFIIPLPPLPEQRLIAEALSDADAWIAALDKLIAKQRALKQAAMDELLTGRTRLPGFQKKPGTKRTEVGVIPEDWELKRIGDLFEILTGKSKSKLTSSGGRYLIVDMGAISRDGQLIASKRTDHASDMLRVGDLAMPKDDIGGGNIIGKVAFIDEDDRYVLGDHVYLLRSAGPNSKFMSYAINSDKINSTLRTKASGSAQLGLARSDVEAQVLPLPPRPEQRAIAQALADMDAEIEALERQRAKAQAIKQGMMQELLTGRIRLVRPGATHNPTN